MSLYCICLVDF